MARPRRSDGKLQVQLFVTNRYRYAITQDSIRDKTTGKYSHPKKIWGTVDEKMVFVPSASYLLLSSEERETLAFPESWSLDKIQELKTASSVRGRPSYCGEASSLLYGDTYFLYQVAERLGLRDDLIHVFDSAEMADKVLTIAMYNLLTQGSFCHLAGMQKISWFPCEKQLDASSLTRLTQSITEAHRQTLFRCLQKRTDEKTWMGIDSTSLTYFGQSLAESKWGRNKEHDDKPQINVMVVYNLDGSRPVYYRKMPGNLPDTRSLRIALDELRENGFDDLRLILDRGYISQQVLEQLAKRKQEFIIMAKCNDKQIAETIRIMPAPQITTYTNWIDKHKVFGVDFGYNLEVTVKNEKRTIFLRACLFFDPELQGEEQKAISEKVSEMERTLNAMKDDKDEIDSVTLQNFVRFFDVFCDKRNRISTYSVNEEKIRAAWSRTGYFAVLCNQLGKKCTLSEILDNYASRDEQEKAFMFMKSEQGGRRFRTSTETSTDGRLFIQFCSLMLNTYVFKVYQESETLQKLFPSRKHMYDELRSIRLIRHPGRAKTISEFIGRQVDVFDAFNFDIPKGCRPVSRKEKQAALSE